MQYQVFATFHCAGTLGLQSQKGTKAAKLSDFCKNQSAQVDKTVTTWGFFEDIYILTSALNTMVQNQLTLKEK